MTHDHFGNGSRAARLLLARLHFDDEARQLVEAEIGGCGTCWQAVTEEMMRREATRLVLSAGVDGAIHYVEGWTADMLDAEAFDHEDRNSKENRSMATELRSTGATVEIRSAGRTIGGYAAKFNSRSQPLAGFHEVVAPTFFNESRDNRWEGVVCRWDHKSEFLLGATGSGTLRCSVDAVGLDYTVDVPESRGDVLESVRRGDIAHSSFSFAYAVDVWDFADGLPLRTLVSGQLIDVAPVAIPAYRNSTVAMRSLARHKSAPVEDVVALAESGDLRKLFTRSDRAPLSGAVARAAAMRRRYPQPAQHLDGAVAHAHARARRTLE